MKASELIKKLQELVAENGDLHVHPILDEDDSCENRDVYEVLIDDCGFNLCISLPNNLVGDEVECIVCGEIFDNPYKVGGDREGLEDLDSLYAHASGCYKDQNTCNECYAKDPEKGFVRIKE